MARGRSTWRVQSAKVAVELARQAWFHLSEEPDMLQQKPIEWRRFERVQLEGEVAKGTSARPATPLPPSPATHTPATAAPSLLHEFERVLRENERLRLELSKLQEKAVENKNETRNSREEQRRKRPEIAILPEAEPVRDDPRAELKPDEPMMPAAAVQSDESLAKVVASYIFEEPTEQNIRLVADALRARGINTE